MKVHGNQDIQKMMALYRKNQQQRPAAKPQEKGAQLEISEAGRALYDRMQGLSSKDVVSRKAKDVKAAYQAGRYQVDEAKLARRMVEVMKEDRGV